jgi:glutamate-5-semialdehyde dehydrogenase
MKSIPTMCQNAKSASRSLAILSTRQKNEALLLLAQWLIENQTAILESNQLDVIRAREQGLSAPLLDRLTLTSERIKTMAEDVAHVAGLPDPIGEAFEPASLPNGLKLHKQRVPLGVLAVIYESRPNVTVDVSCLALKSGNAVILRGGSETLSTNTTLVKGIQSTLKQSGISQDAVQLIDDPARGYLQELLKMRTCIDLLIPRGGAELQNYCLENSSIPVITGGIGICHLFVDESADLPRSLQVILNAKIQQPTVCNALDTVLVHRSIARQFVPGLIAELSRHGVCFRVDPLTLQELKLQVDDCVQPAGVKDFDTEWLSLVLGIRVVEGIDQAIEHIINHTTGHSDGILTEDKLNADKFVHSIDSAAVYVNASTRFTDGGQFGLGSEVAVSTQRLHARGPMGLRELTSYKWVVQGDYQVRE